MRIINKIFFSFMCFILSSQVHGQYVAHYTYKDNIKSDTLTDITTGHRFIIDTNRIYISALDKSGDLIWKTDPVIDNKLKQYKVKRPTIVYFTFGKDGETIHIVYNNSQFGYLDKSTGTFHFQGQD